MTIDWENNDRPLDLGVPYFQTNPNNSLILGSELWNVTFLLFFRLIFGGCHNLDLSSEVLLEDLLFLLFSNLSCGSLGTASPQKKHTIKFVGYPIVRWLILMPPYTTMFLYGERPMFHMFFQFTSWVLMGSPHCPVVPSCCAWPHRPATGLLLRHPRQQLGHHHRRHRFCPSWWGVGRSSPPFLEMFHRSCRDVSS